MPLILSVFIIILSYMVIWFGGFYLILKINQKVKKNWLSVSANILLGFILLILSIFVLRIL
ncbi:MAG: hypothetical protein KDD41_03850 [Flavobacteriales bacterium]|nr:hypothetical protein [Flavobacteriales bacterium]